MRIYGQKKEFKMSVKRYMVNMVVGTFPTSSTEFGVEVNRVQGSGPGDVHRNKWYYHVTLASQFRLTTLLNRLVLWGKGRLVITPASWGYFPKIRVFGEGVYQPLIQDGRP